MPAPLFHRRRLMAAAALSLLFVAGCGHGSKVTSGEIEVYYKDGATKAEAERLAAYLARTWGAGERRSVQLVRAGDGFQLRMVVKKEYQNNEAMLKGLDFEGARASRDVFDGAAVELHACDENFKTLHTFPPRPDVRYGIVEGKVEVFYATPADKDDAHRLAKYLAGELAASPAVVSFKLARRGEVVEVHMVVNTQQLSDQGVVASLRSTRNEVADNVFKGSAVELHLCDALLNVVQVLKP